MWGANSTLALLFSSFSFLSSKAPIVTTNFGDIEGVISTSRNGSTTYEFLGIPYAQPPIGDLRFKPPIAWNETWENVRDGSTFGQRCVQYHLIARFLTGGEDCLFLNVYTHKFKRPGEEDLPEEDLKDVIVYIHGGIFMQGYAGFYKPHYFMDEDVVLVIIQYRVGALGFLNMEDENIQGNMGLKDQNLALKWIQQNIKNFGGNPQKVTILGESAGSVSVHLHMLSPMSTGLFHRAISQSGTALVSWGLKDHPFEQAKYFAERLNCLRPTKKEMAECLRSVDALSIGKVQKEAAGILHHKYALFGPTIEVEGENSTERFLPDHPANIIKSGNFSKVPWICGANSEEGLIYAAPIIKNETVRSSLNSNWTHWIPIIFRFDDEPNKAAIANRIREYYFGNDSAEISFKTLPALTSFLTDRSFFEGIHHTLQLHKGQHPIYPYHYAYAGEFSFGRLVLGMSFNLPVMADVIFSTSWNWISTKVLRSEKPNYGIAHGDELPLIFNLPFQKIHSEDSPDFHMSKTLIKTWTRFAIDGFPPQVDGVTWPEMKQNDENNTTLTYNNDDDIDDSPIKFLLFNKTIGIIDEPFATRAQFWKSLNLAPENTYYKISNTSNDIEMLNASI